MSARLGLWYCVLGTAFGWVLSRSGAADYGFIQRMFLFQSFQLYGILGSGALTLGLGLVVLKRVGRTLSGAPIAIRPKAVNTGNWVGGALFGIGWSITGMCPGPIIVNLGEGKVYAVFALLGVLAGTWAVGWLRPWLAGWLGLGEWGSQPTTGSVTVPRGSTRRAATRGG